MFIYVVILKDPGKSHSINFLHLLCFLCVPIWNLSANRRICTLVSVCPQPSCYNTLTSNQMKCWVKSGHPAGTHVNNTAVNGPEPHTRMLILSLSLFLCCSLSLSLSLSAFTETEIHSRLCWIFDQVTADHSPVLRVNI